MLRLRNVLLAVLALLLTLPAFAQDANWHIYLFDSNTNALIRVNADGTSATYSLDIPQGNYLVSMLRAFDSSGSRIAFCTVDHSDTNESLYTLYVRDIASEANLLTIPYGAVQGCSVSAFSADDAQIAVSIVNRGFMMEPGSPETPDWQLLLLDATSGAVMRELNSFNPTMPEFAPFGEVLPLMPLVENFGADAIEFIGLPYVGMGGPPTLPAYRWSLADDTVTELGERSLLGDALVATGERIMPQLDESQPAAMPMGPLPQANTVVLEDASGSRVIYRNSEWIIVNVRFISDGQQIAIQLLSGFDEANPNDTSKVRYVVLDRNGNVRELGHETMSVSVMSAVPGGAAWTWVDYDATAANQPPPTTSVEFFNGEATTGIWTYQQPAGETLSFYQAVWSPEIIPAADLQPFPAH